MNFRFRVLGTSNAINPDTFNCGAVFAPLALNSFSLYVKIDSTVVAIIPIGSLTTGTSISTAVGALTATVSIENSNYIKISLNLANRDHYADLTLNLVHPDATPYINTFRIYGFDIGKNPNIVLPPGVTNNTTPFDIKMIPQVWTVPSTQIKYKQCASAFLYRDYVEKKVNIIKTSSSNGDATYFNTATGAVLASGDFVRVGDEKGLLSNLTMVVGDPNGVSSAILPVPAIPITTPLLGFSINNLECTSCNCVNPSSTINLTTNLGVIQDFLQDDDDKDTVYSILHNTIELVDMLTGLVTYTQAYSYAPNPALNTITQVFTPIGMLDDRQYKIIFTVRLTDEDGIVLGTEEFLLEPCSVSELTKKDCNIYNWQNRAGVATLTLKQVNQDGTYITIETRTNVATGAIEIFTLKDGVYILEVRRANVLVYSYKLVSMCMYINCLTKYTAEVACPDPCADSTGDCGCKDCTDCKDCGGSEDRYNFYLLSVTYMSLINKLYLENQIFETLSTDSAKTMQDLALITDRMTKYCVGCQ